MTPEITSAHRDLLAHLLDPEHSAFGVVPLALAGHYRPGSYEADMRFDWLDPFPAFAHPADPARLLIGVDTDRGWTLVALDHLAHSDCAHPICRAVTEHRWNECREIPDDGMLFAALDVATSWDGAPLTYLVHIDDYQAAQNSGWTGDLADHVELRWSIFNPAWPSDGTEDLSWLA